VLTLAEYEEQFETRYSQEVMTFLETVMTLDRMSDKNRFIEEFIFEVVRGSETAYVTPRNTTQIIAQSIQLKNTKLQSLIRLL
jgi:hypothetical protein